MLLGYANLRISKATHNPPLARLCFIITILHSTLHTFFCLLVLLLPLLLYSAVILAAKSEQRPGLFYFFIYFFTFIHFYLTRNLLLTTFILPVVIHLDNLMNSIS